MATKIYYNSSGVQDVLMGEKLANLEREMMESKLSEIQAQFVMDFGTEGAFMIEQHTSAPNPKFGTTRTTFRIVATDAKTGAILKRHPGWLDKFIQT